MRSNNKKYLSAVLTFGMALSLYACGGNDEANPAKKAATREEGHKKDGHKKGIVLLSGSAKERRDQGRTGNSSIAPRDDSVDR